MNTCASVSFLRKLLALASNFIEREALAQVYRRSDVFILLASHNFEQVNSPRSMYT